MAHYKGPDYYKTMASFPVSPMYELFVFKFAVNLLMHMRSQ